MKERKEKKNSFADDDLENLLEDILAMKLVELPELKKLEE